MATYYEVLGVSKDASQDEIKKKWRELTIKWHPDTNHDKDTETKYKEINAAYDVLGNPENRREYDASLVAGIHGDFGADSFEHGGFGFDSDPFAHMHSDIFGSFFVNNDPFVKSNARNKLRDVHINIKVSVKDAYKGTTLEVEYNTNVLCDACYGTGQVATTPCDKCHGAGMYQERVKNTIEVYPGVRNGEVIVLYGTKGKPDLYAHVIITNTKEFIVDPSGSFNIIRPLQVDYTSIILGDVITIKSIDGKRNIKVEIPQGMQHAHRVPIKGEGFRAGNEVGDMIVVCEINIPTADSVSDTEKKLLEKIKKSRKRTKNNNTVNTRKNSRKRRRNPDKIHDSMFGKILDYIKYIFNI